MVQEEQVVEREVLAETMEMVATKVEMTTGMTGLAPKRRARRARKRRMRKKRKRSQKKRRMTGQVWVVRTSGVGGEPQKAKRRRKTIPQRVRVPGLMLEERA